MTDAVSEVMQNDDRERTSFLTTDEVQAVQKLHHRAPYSLANVSLGFFSAAQHYGGCAYNGYHYIYIAEHDECVRDDVLKVVLKMRKTSVKLRTAQLYLLNERLGVEYGMYKLQLQQRKHHEQTTQGT